MQKQQSEFLCTDDQSHQLWLTETRLLVLWGQRSMEDYAECALQRASVVTTSEEPLASLSKALRIARSRSDLKLHPPCSSKQRKYQAFYLEAAFRPILFKVHMPSTGSCLAYKPQCCRTLHCKALVRARFGSHFSAYFSPSLYIPAQQSEASEAESKDVSLKQAGGSFSSMTS